MDMNMLKIVFVALMLIPAGCGPGMDGNSGDNGATRQGQAGFWIDVRTGAEFAAGHLEGAVNIPHDRIGTVIGGVVPDKDREIRLYCRSGRRSGIALKTLKELGYTNVINEGAYKKLRRARQGSVSR